MSPQPGESRANGPTKSQGQYTKTIKFRFKTHGTSTFRIDFATLTRYALAEDANKFPEWGWVPVGFRLVKFGDDDSDFQNAEHGRKECGFDPQEFYDMFEDGDTVEVCYVRDPLTVPFDWATEVMGSVLRYLKLTGIQHRAREAEGSPSKKIYFIFKTGQKISSPITFDTLTRHTLAQKANEIPEWGWVPVGFRSTSDDGRECGFDPQEFFNMWADGEVVQVVYARDPIVASIDWAAAKMDSAMKTFKLAG